MSQFVCLNFEFEFVSTYSGSVGTQIGITTLTVWVRTCRTYVACEWQVREDVVPDSSALLALGYEHLLL